MLLFAFTLALVSCAGGDDGDGNGGGSSGLEVVVTPVANVATYENSLLEFNYGGLPDGSDSILKENMTATDIETTFDKWKKVATITVTTNKESATGLALIGSGLPGLAPSTGLGIGGLDKDSNSLSLVISGPTGITGGNVDVASAFFLGSANTVNLFFNCYTKALNAFQPVTANADCYATSDADITAATDEVSLSDVKVYIAVLTDQDKFLDSVIDHQDELIKGNFNNLEGAEVKIETITIKAKKD